MLFVSPSRLRRRALSAGMALVFSLATLTGAFAQQVGIIRDAEIESMIRDFAAPLLKAAGVRSLPHVYLVSDRRFNAFVVEDGSLFINYGTIIDVETPNALKAILAHEIGHLAGGDISRLKERAETTGRMQAIAMVLGIGAAAAAAGAGAGGNIGGLASAFILASQSAGSNSLMAYRRDEESAADAAGLKFLEKTGQSGRGMVQVLEELQAREGAGISPYLRSHPLASDRLDQIRTKARSSRYWSRTDSRTDIARLALARAKLVGFLESQQTVLNLYPNSDKSLAARYARILTAYKSGATISALQLMPQLVAANPSNPYFQEMLGQMYFESGQANKALAPLKKAVRLAPQAVLIRTLYGQALIGAGGKANLEEAVLQLTRAAREEPDSTRAYTLLAQAYGGLGQQGQASLAAAEAALARNDKPTALALARKARDELPQGSPAWIRADDILSLR